MRERSLIVNDAPVERRLLDHTERGFGYEPGLALLDESGHVRALADIEAEAIRFAIGHYRGQMSEVARRLHIGRSTLAHCLFHSLPQAGVAPIFFSTVGSELQFNCNPVTAVEKNIGSPLAGG